MFFFFFSHLHLKLFHKSYCTALKIAIFLDSAELVLTILRLAGTTVPIIYIFISYIYIYVFIRINSKLSYSSAKINFCSFANSSQLARNDVKLLLFSKRKFAMNSHKFLKFSQVRYIKRKFNLSGKIKWTLVFPKLEKLFHDLAKMKLCRVIYI